MDIVVNPSLGCGEKKSPREACGLFVGFLTEWITVYFPRTIVAPVLSEWTQAAGHLPTWVNEEIRECFVMILSKPVRTRSV